MPRICYFGALLGVAVSLWIPAAAQKRAHVVVPRIVVQHVLVRGTGDAMEVEIQTSGAPVTPDTEAITDPDRIVVDFPGALPSSELRALRVNRGALKAVRAGLFFRNPPITRIVLDLAEPQSYRISTIPSATVVKLGPPGPKLENLSSVSGSASPAAKLQNASLGSGTKIAAGDVSNADSPAASLPAAVNDPPQQPPLTVTYTRGMLRIRADRATLAQVLFEVQRQTQADIAIPAGAEEEEVFADLGPAPAREVLGELLNGSHYNFIFVGKELTLERVILTRRDPSE